MIEEAVPLIFRAPLRSAGGDVDHREAVAFAFAKGVVGPGWGLDPPPPKTFDEALERLWEVSKPGFNTVRRFGLAPTGSLVWSRDLTGRYLVGELIGEWQYDASEEAKKVDLQNFRPVAWAPRTLLDDEVPAAVVRQWSGRSSSFHKIHSEPARLLSARLYDELMGKELSPLELTQAADTRSTQTRARSLLSPLSSTGQSASST